MAKVIFSRGDIQALAERLDARAWSPICIEMPELQRDIRSAAALLRFAIDRGIPVHPIELDIWNGTI